MGELEHKVKQAGLKHFIHHAKPRKTKFELSYSTRKHRYLPINRTDRRRTSLNHHSRPQYISSSFSPSVLTGLVVINVLVDIASAFLSLGIIHDI